MLSLRGLSVSFVTCVMLAAIAFPLLQQTEPLDARATLGSDSMPYYLEPPAGTEASSEPSVRLSHGPEMGEGLFPSPFWSAPTSEEAGYDAVEKYIELYGPEARSMGVPELPDFDPDSDSMSVPEVPVVPDPPEVPLPEGDVVLDVLFCLDTTGSMSDEISVAKSTILDIADAVADGNPRPYVRYALVIYRDGGDDFVTRTYDFMTATELSSVLNNVAAGGGGDYRESVSEALHRSVYDVSWDLENATKAIYLIGDAPPHTDYTNGYDHVEAAKAAARKGIMIHAIGCSGISGNEDEFKEVVELTGGTFVYLTYSGSGGYGGPGGCYGGGYGDGYGGSYESEGEVGTTGTGTGSGSGGGSGGDDRATNDLDAVLTELIQQQAMDAGVNYDEDGSE